MSSPLSFLADHENLILVAYRDNNNKPRDTWLSLEKYLPELSQTMTFNTFKQYISVFAFVKNRLDKVRQEEVIQEISNIKNEKTKLEQELLLAKHRLDKVRQNQDALRNKLERALEEKVCLESELKHHQIKLDKVRQNKRNSQVNQKLDKTPKRISGWSVQYSKDGYYRCYRKIDKRVHSIYLGKELDIKEAENRISAKEKSLGLK